MTNLLKLKEIKYILQEEKWNTKNIQNVLNLVDQMIETTTKRRKTVKAGVSAAKKASKKKAPEMFSWEWWIS